MTRIVSGLASQFASSKNVGTSSPSIFAARVKFIFLDDKTNSTLFKEYGEWAALGGIFFESLNAPGDNKDVSVNRFAKPLFSNYKNYPLINEIVYITALPSTEVQTNVNDIDYYYFQPVNLWNSIHHNAIPDPIFGSTLPSSQQKDYQSTEQGSVRKVTDGSTDIKLGDTFKEKLKIKNLLPYEGDVIHEGRWGNSIRFGSTVKDAKISNPWSKNGENGDPLIIVRNGQHDDGKDPWVPTVEDINKDGSSIYLTSKQQIPITVSSDNYSSYDNAPTKPKEYKEEQIILSSNRLLFDAKKDSILFSAKKSINLNSADTVNIDAKNKFTIDSKKILIGSKNSSEPLMLGNKTIESMGRTLDELINISANLTALIGNLGVPVNPALIVAANQAIVKLGREKGILKSLLSKKSFTE